MEIKYRFTSKILFKFETDSMKICLEKAVEAEADLSNADLSNANLSNADLSNANLANVLNYYSPTEILLCDWGTVREELCVELMRWDAWNHSDGSKFDEWVTIDQCPYGTDTFQRAANFRESKELWKKHGYAQPKSAYELVMMLFAEKKIKFNWENE